MSGFKNTFLNNSFRQILYEEIIEALLLGCKIMKDELIYQNKYLPNNEEKIRNYLLENYLENDTNRANLKLGDIGVRFQPELLENYNIEDNRYVGRTDIKVVSCNWFANKNDYYIIECKRIDGTLQLNQKYIDEGVCRFLGDKPKYRSYNNKNIMLGFIVKDEILEESLKEIKKLHNDGLKKIIKKDLTLFQKNNECYLGESQYNNDLLLSHLFYDLSIIIK